MHEGQGMSSGKGLFGTQAASFVRVSQQRKMEQKADCRNAPCYTSSPGDP